MATHTTTLTEAVATEVVTTQVFTGNEESMAAKTHPAFASPDADVQLCSKDNTTFCIHSHTLVAVSGWFRTMFTLPQDTAGVSANTIEVIHVQEDADVLAGLLAIVSGTGCPDLKNIDYLESLLCAAEKYEMPLPIAIARVALMSPVVNASPIRVYGIACRMNWIPEAKLASTRTLVLDLFAPGWVAELDRVDAPHLTKLIALHRQRKERFIAALDSPTFFANHRPAKCFNCGRELVHHEWQSLKYRWAKQMDKRPFGEHLSSEYMDVEELAAVLGARCPIKNVSWRNCRDVLSSLISRPRE
ncbi:hypothetical protein A0H81_00722 [Grifola frondosa]|uniref:Uncharacterized protein n=1 Tax=Grifola frondosa TaxID=5627 RepID=A0A1C7MU20_GRIFR|nr:hypothetical protein A0H81_00722 [Grifola frondosa]